MLLWVIVSVMSTFLTGGHTQMSDCPTDCLTQAGVPCEIITKPGVCPDRVPGTDGQLPGLPVDVKVTHYMKDTIPQLNVTWGAPQTGLASLRGYELSYSRYVDTTDTTGPLGPDGREDVCVHYNITTNIHPQPSSEFHHDCVHQTQHYFRLASLPYKSRDKNYVHRVVAVFNQTSDYTAFWQPPLVVIHNNSCNHTVHVELTLAPKSHNFQHYRVALRYADPTVINDSDRMEFYVEPGTETYSLQFTEVESDAYIIGVYPEPHNAGGVCSCPSCFPEPRCVSSKTGAFIIDGEHPKCQVDLAPDDSTDPPPTPPSSITPIIAIALATVSVFIGVVACAILVRSSRKPKDKIPENNTENNRRVDDWLTNAPSSIFGDLTSQHMAGWNEAQSEQYGAPQQHDHTQHHVHNPERDTELNNFQQSGNNYVMNTPVELEADNDMDLDDDFHDSFSTDIPMHSPRSVNGNESLLHSIGPDSTDFPPAEVDNIPRDMHDFDHARSPIPMGRRNNTSDTQGKAF